MKRCLLILIILFLQGCSESGKVSDKGEGNNPISTNEALETEETDNAGSITVAASVYHWQGNYDTGFAVNENINLDNDEFVETVEISGGKPEGDSTVPDDFYIRITDTNKNTVLPHISESGSPHVFSMDMNKDGYYEFIISDSYRGPATSEVYTYNGEEIILIAHSITGDIKSVENDKVLLSTGVELSFNGKNVVNQKGAAVGKSLYASEEDDVHEDEEVAPETVETEKETTEAVATEEPTNHTILMKVNPEEFKVIFNNTYKKVYKELTPSLQKTVGNTKIPETLITGEYDWGNKVFTYYFNKDLRVTGSINEDGTIKVVGLYKELPEEVTLNISEELLMANAQHAIAQQALIRSVSEGTTKQDVEQIFKGFVEEYKQASDTPTVVYEGIKYSDITDKENPKRHFNLFTIMLEGME
ncbi:hypothetical protein [Neobacillus sp. YIM B06451]|uniref:hypothetical protein n=1 Tax=Neobacillus sp. YIM B06451 TaxID=3070994 RepID=UPI00292DEEBD|nr:hypothetical protein [Neobacillus sp. YIM B06451]